MANINLKTFLIMDINEIKNETVNKSRFKREASDIFRAQEKNKKKVCTLSNKELWEKQLQERSEPDKNAQAGRLNRDQLIRKYVYLVNWVVGRLPLSGLKGIDRDDLVGYGTIGLIEAVDRFDPERNSNFESFAITRIRGSVYDQLRAADWLTRGSRKKVKNLHKAIAKLENEFGRYPTNQEIANEMSIPIEELRSIQQEAQIGIFSLDEPRDINSEDSTTLVDNVSSNETHFLDELEEGELKTRLVKAIDALPEREKTVVGLYHYKRLTFKEIATIMDFSESRASQIHARAISLLKSKLLRD